MGDSSASRQVEESAAGSASGAASEPGPDGAAVLDEVSVVIPSLSADGGETAACLPDAVGEVVVSTTDDPSKARNHGIERATNDDLVVMDDDLAFAREWFVGLANRVHGNPGTVYAAHGHGILNDVSWPPGFEPGMSRVMGFHREAFDAVGGFVSPGHMADDPDYGSDTDFLMSAFEVGYEVRLLSHDWTHLESADEYTFGQHLRWLAWLARRHPRLVGPRLPAVAAAKLGWSA